MKYQREFFRISIERTGQLRRGTDTAACQITQLTPYGIGLSTDLLVTCGEAIELEFQLTNECPIRCTVLVTHAIPPILGGRVTAISPEHQTWIAQFLDQHAAISLTAL
ncbi:MAG: hypothetical protein HY205_07450 [Nitrospirae bacterium]|nr:hypothetical protein [Nitrospirota bacterium]